MSDKLTLIKSDVNSGGGGTPRNIGIRYSYGEYLMFVDSDDAITKDALKDFYAVAKEFDADVVHCEKCLSNSTGNTITNTESLNVVKIKMADFVDKPTLMSDNLETRIQIFCANKFDWSTYTNFIRRDLILRHDLRFPDFKVCEDAIFSMYLLCLAKRFLLTPTVHYVYRLREDSVCRSDSLSAEEIMKRWGDFFFRGITMLDKFFDKFQTFRKRPEYKYAVYDLLMSTNNGPILSSYSKASLSDIEKFARAELMKVDDMTAITAFLFNRMNIMNWLYLRLQGSVRQLKEIAQMI